MSTLATEAQIKTRLRAKLEQAGWFVLHLVQTNKGGITDTLILRDGRYVWIEFKRVLNARTGRQTHSEPLQLFRQEELRKHGAEVITDVVRIEQIQHLL